MVALPIEILQHICELAAEGITTHHDDQHTVDQTDVHFMSLLGFSQASWACREVSASYLFRRIRIRTVEQALAIVQSSIAQYARHVHFPVVDALTCRRPIPPPVLQLVSRATSIRISASTSSFFYTARTPLSSLFRSAKELFKLELYCEPITYSLDTLALVAKNFIPICPKSLKALYITMPGGQPDYTGPQKILGALSSSCTGIEQLLSRLEFIHISVHLSPRVASCPEQLALGIAQRLPSLRHINLVPDPRKLRTAQELSLFELIEPTREAGISRRDTTSWRVLRDAYMNDVPSDSHAGGGIRLEGIQ